jgi:hypothetical protein
MRVMFRVSVGPVDKRKLGDLLEMLPAGLDPQIERIVDHEDLSDKLDRHKLGTRMRGGVAPVIINYMKKHGGEAGRVDILALAGGKIKRAALNSSLYNLRDRGVVRQNGTGRFKLVKS